MNKIYCFGGVTEDITAFNKDKTRVYESNPSSVRITFGGVGRNIVRSIANYKKCEFISSIPMTPFFDSLKADLISNGVNLDHIINAPSECNSVYIDIIDKDGVFVGASDLSALDLLDFNHIKSFENVIDDNDIAIIDTNFSGEIIEYFLTHIKGFKVVDAVSSKKFEKIIPFIERFDLVKMNNYEAEKVNGKELKNYIITTGSGAKIKYQDKLYEISSKKLEPINPTGCGDTFIGAFIANLDRGIKYASFEAIKSAAISSQVLYAVPTKEDLKMISESELNIVWKEL